MDNLYPLEVIARCAEQYPIVKEASDEILVL